MPTFGNGSEPFVTPTLNTDAYSIGDCVGGLMTFQNILNVSTRSGLLVNARLIMRVNVQAAMDLILFRSSPSGIFNNNEALPVVAGNEDLVIDSIPIVATDYRLLWGTVYLARPPIEHRYFVGNNGPSGDNIYGILSAKAAFTLAVGAITVWLSSSRD